LKQQADLIVDSLLVDNFALFHVQDRPYLVSKQTGVVLSTEGSAEMFMDLLGAGLSQHEVIQLVAEAYNLPQEQITGDLRGFLDSLERLSEAPSSQQDGPDGFPIGDFIPGDKEILTEGTGEEQVRYFVIAGHCFEFIAPASLGLDPVDALFESFMAEASSVETPTRVMVEKGGNGYALRVGDEIKSAYDDIAQTPQFMRSALFEYIASQTPFSVFLHAAAIENQRREAVLFIAPSGHGKSTLMAELVFRGQGYLGDDAIMLSLPDQTVQAIPSALNLKSGAWELFSDRITDLDDYDVYESEGRTLKYIPLACSDKALKQRLDCCGVIFPEYSAYATPEFRQLAPGEIFSKLKDAGVHTNAEAGEEMSRLFVEFFLGRACYAMRYSHSDQAISFLADQAFIAGQ